MSTAGRHGRAVDGQARAAGAQGRAVGAQGRAVGGQGGGTQVIPRPPGARPGPPPPWAGRSPERVTVADVRAAVAGGAVTGGAVGGDAVDGAVGAIGQTPIREQPPVMPAPAPAPAAVLCAVFDTGGQAAVVLTRRSQRMRSHTGEVSFPGGRLELGEAPEVGALREAEEEVGIEPAAVEVIGQLSPLTTALNTSAISPVVGILPAPPVLVPNPHEVERAFSAPLVELFADGVGHEERWPLAGQVTRSFYFFSLVGDTVWGATARMLWELLERVWAIHQ